MTISNNNLVEWQLVDPSTNIIYPWFVHPFLAQLQIWSLENARILELGSGASTAWWRSRSKWVDSVEADMEWGLAASEYAYRNGLENGCIYRQQIADGTEDGLISYGEIVTKLLLENDYHVIVVDGIYRVESLQWAVSYFQSHEGGIIVADNWQQDYVFISPKAEEIMAPFPINNFIQPDHTNHDGRPWATAFWIIPPKQSPYAKV